MSPYRQLGEMDDPIAPDGDPVFVGWNTYDEPSSLEKGMVQTAENVRMTGDRIEVRKGLDFLAGSVTLTHAEDTEQIFASGTYSDPDDDNKNWLVAATKTKAIIWSKDNTSGLNVAYYSATCASGSVDNSNNKFTISSHKFQVGDPVQLTTSGALPTDLAADTTYYIIDSATNDIKFATTLANALSGTIKTFSSDGSGTHTVQSVMIDGLNPMITQAFNKVYLFRLGSRPLAWDGNTAATGSNVNSKFESLSSSASGSGDPLPSSDFGIYFRNRMIVSQPPTTTTPTTSKTGAQTIVASDLLTENNVTPTESEFYLNFGSADHFIGAIPYQDNQLLCFLRHSVHLISNIQQTSASGHFEITREHGCVARESIAQSGPQTYFLSDKGVYVVSPGVDPAKGLGIAISKVQGESIPLSRPIQSEFDNVNFNENAIATATGIFFDNKYYIAVPLNDETKPTTVFVYDALLQAWVSKDTFPSGFTIEKFVVMPYGSNPEKLRLFAVNPKGWFLMEENAGLDDSGRTIGSTSATTTTAVAGKFKTRNYTLGDMGVKRWHDGQLAIETVSGDSMSIVVNTLDPDRTATALTHTATATEETLLRFGARVRGYGANVEVTTSAGSPKFRHVLLHGSQALHRRLEIA